MVMATASEGNPHPANLCASLIGFHPLWLKGLQGMGSFTTDLGL